MDLLSLAGAEQAQLRAGIARPRVEDGREPLEMIARDVGFTDPERMRQSFTRVFGQAPRAIRRAARNMDRVAGGSL